MSQSVRVAVPRKGRPLEAVLERIAMVTDAESVVDEVISTLRHEKAITKGSIDPTMGVYERLSTISTLHDEYKPEYTLRRDDRPGMPRRIVFDTLTIDISGIPVQLIGREEPFRALRTHTFGLGFDSADLVLEEVVDLRADGIDSIDEINARIDPMNTDVRVVTGLGDTVYHTLLARPDVLDYDVSLDRSFIIEYQGTLCISPRYERLVEAVLGTYALDDVSFKYPHEEQQEEAAISNAGVGVYLTVTGSTAREHGLVVGEELFPSETVLMQNNAETTAKTDRVRDILATCEMEEMMTEINTQSLDANNKTTE
ncbi:hypothetical protein [Haloquadratum walsbyi]|jgi:hypothetical protein|uniref:ATP phosphoribosyltransferase n=1 Tax=Haloquadratum walsbyi (strain DSM 16790 / HBSQ001) TaxID=362976 RepID=Q18H41_HALWD|nr:hypothetical protein [Haloquadratum walsbyi]CAJ52704.1 uncharacterized protein HQ_2592A [Haloquadratum walsbyi DSM 16790]